MAVLRPKDPAMALMLARIALDKNDAALFERIPAEVEDYTFVGWMPEPRADVPMGYVVDGEGFIIDDMQSGDSFCTMQDRESGEEAPEGYAAANVARSEGRS
jgi:hypothetical protein